MKIMKINQNENEDKNEKRSPRSEANRPSSKHGHKYSKCKKCFSMMMLICINQHLSSIWSSIHEKVDRDIRYIAKLEYRKLEILDMLQLYLKDTPAQVFFCDFCEIFKNFFFTEHLQTTTSDNIMKFIFPITYVDCGNFN